MPELWVIKSNDMKTLSSILATTLVAASISGQTVSNNQKHIGMEQQNIINTVTAIFNGSDERNWDKVERSFANEVLLDYTSMAGGTPSKLSPHQITTAWKTILPGFQSTHHQVGNFTVDVKGNIATVRNHGLALHYLPNPTGNNVWVVVGTYDFTMTKSGDAWRVASMKFNLQKQDGNLSLPALAQQNVKQGTSFASASVAPANKVIIEKFFTSLETLDVPGFLTVWAEDGKQFMPLSPENFPKELNGKQAINNQYKALPENYTSMKFPRKYFATDDPNTVIVQYNGIIPLKEGGEYNNNYVGIFNLQNGKVQQFTEYFDPFILQEAFGKKLESNFNVEATEKATTRKVQFKSEGLVLTGTLHLPKNFDETKKYKGVVVTGSWTTVKEQMPNLYARKLAEQGLVALTFDFRNYGESEGQPRNYEVPAMKARDIINAVSYLKILSFVDADEIGGLAICASSGYMVEAIAKGAEVKALTLVAPWLHNHEIVRQIYGGEEGVSSKIKKSKLARDAFANSGKVQYVPAISTTDANAAMFGEFDYYLNKDRGAISEWGNQFAVMAWEGWLNYDPIQYASKVKVPVLIVHSKTAAVPQGAELFYNNLPGKKNIIWVDKAIQFDFYDQEPYTSNAASDAVKWFGEYLN
jgi:fermentation-respiration switch protein FrsA (DUF1100 family)/ketosteroid isomerase-like protein